MSKLTTILNNSTVPAGEFGTTSTEGKHFGKASRPLKAAAGQTIIRRVRLPATLKFFNPDPPVGPITIILNSESEED